MRAFFILYYYFYYLLRSHSERREESHPTNCNDVISLRLWRIEMTVT